MTHMDQSHKLRQEEMVGARGLPENQKEQGNKGETELCFCGEWRAHAHIMMGAGLLS